MCLWSTDRLIDELYVQLLLLPDARTVLLPESDNCRTSMPAIHRPTDRADMHTIYHRPTNRADMPMIPITVVPISLRPKHDQVELCSLEYNPVAGTVLLVLEYMDRGYVVTCLRMAVLRTKRELPVLECMDRGYAVICCWLVILTVTHQPPSI